MPRRDAIPTNLSIRAIRVELSVLEKRRLVLRALLGERTVGLLAFRRGKPCGSAEKKGSVWNLRSFDEAGTINDRTSRRSLSEAKAWLRTEAGADDITKITEVG